MCSIGNGKKWFLYLYLIKRNMIYSKRGFGKGVLILELLFILILFAGILFIILISTTNTFIASTLIVSGLLVYAIVSIKILLNNLTQVCVDNENKSIVFKRIFPKKNSVFYFNNLDGYITGRIRLLSSGNNRQLIKVVAIVQEKKIVGYFTEGSIENINELEEGIKQLPYLGYQSIGLWARLKLFFGLLYLG